MRPGPALSLIALLGLAGCGEPAAYDRNAADGNSADADTVTPTTTAVRVGELGPSFAACSGAGTTRHVEFGASLPVRSAPFDNAAQTGGIPAGGRFFVCSRSLDEKWFGIVYDSGGRLDARCGVSDPSPARRDYAGPCQSGWVSTPFVRLVAGDEPAAPNQPEGNASGNESG
jgi:hypothetical protein